MESKSLDSGACLFFHRWGCWEDKESGFKTQGSGAEQKHIGKVIIQERRCQRCNMVQLRMAEASL